jgi:LCP family protein required for cell wall assembly
MTATDTRELEIPPPPKQRMSRGRKFVLWLLILAVLGVGSAIGWILWTDSKIDRIPESDLESLQPAIDGPRTFLVVGTDSRENLPDGLGDHFGNFSGKRTDVMMLVQFLPGERAQILSIPRDLKVQIPDEGTNRVNAALTFGGPDLLVRTIQQNLGISINHYIEVDFGGFAAITDALGGVTIDFRYPARDSKSGLDVGAGRQTLDGATALAFARSRHYQELRDGSWTSVDATDIGRTSRQQQILLAMFDKATSPSSAFNLPGFASTVAENITTDASLDLGVLVSIGRAGLDLRSSDLEARTLPVAISNEGGVSYVVRIEPDAQATLDAFAAGLAFPPA